MTTHVAERQANESKPTEKTWVGSCFCGAVRFTVSGEPAAMGYCHCDSCRSWSAGPVNAFSLWKPDQVRITRGADKIGSYQKTPQSVRKWCTVCGGHLLTAIALATQLQAVANVVPDAAAEQNRSLEDRGDTAAHVQGRRVGGAVGLPFKDDCALAGLLQEV